MGEELYELPKGWVWVTIEQLSDVVRGASPRPAGDPKYFGGDIPWITVGCLTANNKPYLTSVSEFVTEAGRAASRYIEPETLLLTNSGATLGVPKITKIGGCINDGSVALLYVDYPLKLYLYYFLSSLTKKLRSINQGAAQPNLNTGIVKSIWVPLPPLLEQHRIVAKIEELFTELDAGVELLKKLKAKLKRYRQAVLKAAVEGNLTKEWREANQGKLEPASMLLERILKQRREKWEAEQLAKMKAQGKTPKDDSWKLKYKEPVALNTSDLPELPDGWCWASLQQCSSRITDGTHQPPKFTDDGIPFIFVQHIVKGFISFEKTKFISESTYEELNSRCPVEPGDILYSAVGSYGVAVPVKEKNKFSFQRHIAHIKPNSLLSQLYLVHCLNSQFCLEQAHKVARGVAQKTVTLGDLSNFLIPIPSIIEQSQIIKNIELKFSVIDQLEKTIDTNLKRAEKLRQSILKQAFEGKLVPQDPNDEPAEKLLERIKAEKAKQTTTKTKRKTQSKTESNIQLELPLQ